MNYLINNEKKSNNFMFNVKKGTFMVYGGDKRFYKRNVLILIPN